jgi:putative PIN family toxin of toxin-antitoxin system
MNIVVDTSVLISAILWKGPPAEALKIILSEHFLAQSQATLREFASVIHRDKFKVILQKRGLTPEILVQTLPSPESWHQILSG